MTRLRTFLGVSDELQDFAEDWLNGSANLSSAKSLSNADGVLVACLYRDSTYQVEMCCASPGLVIPDHVHPHADTIELTVAGILRLRVNGKDVYSGMSDEYVQRLNHWRGIRINRGDIHGTAYPVGERGAIFLSIQKWVDSPRSVLTDYDGVPLGGIHRRMLS